MFDALSSNALLQVSVTEAMIEHHESIQSTQLGHQRVATKLYALSSCATRLYAIYENFVETLLCDYLDYISELIAFGDLDSGIKNDYRIGISHILAKLDSHRYRQLKHENIVSWYHGAISNSPNYKFVTEAFTRHESNLRLGVLDNMVKRLGLNDLESWLAANEHTAALYEDASGIVSRLQAELELFIDLRNEAAHGTLGHLEGHNNQLRYCTLCRAIIRSLTDYFSKALLTARVRAGRSKRIGIVTEVFKKPQAFIIRLSPGSKIQLAQPIHFLSPSHYQLECVKTLQSNDVNVSTLVSTAKVAEAGVTCANLPRSRCEVYVDI